MKVEVGKFYKTRGGEKVSVLSIRDDIAVLSNNHYVFVDTGNANYEHNGPCDTDLIEEWKEPEVKEPKFKVGDRVLPNKEEWHKEGHSESRVYQHWNDCWNRAGAVKDGDIFYVIKVDGDKLGYSNKPNGIGPLSTPARFFELVEPKPEITVNSRWTNIGKESKTVTVVHINDKYVTFEHDGRGTIETTTRDTFHHAYKPYVEPPKSLVGYVGVLQNKETKDVNFIIPYLTEDLVHTYHCCIAYNYDLVSIKKIEWTEGE